MKEKPTAERIDKLVQENLRLRGELSEDHPEVDFMAECLNFSLGTLRYWKGTPQMHMENLIDLSPDEFRDVIDNLRSVGDHNFANRIEKFKRDFDND